MKESITLRDIVQFPTQYDPPGPIQVVMPHEDWEDFIELPSTSPLLDAFLDYEIDSLNGEMSIRPEWGCILRVAIREPKNEEES